ncbi:hypothetical protein FIBSPDRAFT_60546 [Athelia psychrophila]|uniref:C2H2-type domain-containing protein n=1 Tax=Athelia psychrophila TaxID=1759441 RepID=A0A166F5D8_9AGAM|nr:hypothetical protein FIBSPDRAFT_60546 [Fibularhizoctonia sp. CBS 109695]
MSINGSDDVRVDIPSESENIASKHWDDPFSDAGSDITGMGLYMDIETASSTAPEVATSSIPPATGPVSIAKFSPEATFACGFNNCTTPVANSSRAFTAHILAAHHDLCTSPENFGLSPVPVDCWWIGCKAKARYSGVLGAPEFWRHVQMHWGGAVHACSVCNHELTRKDSCDRHIKQQHSG